MRGHKKLRVQYVEVATKAVKLVHQAKVWEVRDAVFSPDSKWIAFSQQEEEGLSKVYRHSVEQGKSYEVTDGWFGWAGPVFSGDGKYLLKVLLRDFNPIYSDTEWNHAYKDMQRIYLVTLAKDTPSPFRPRNDELEGPKEDGKKDGPIKVDVDGIKDRILQLPVQPAGYFDLQPVGNSVYYLRRGTKDAQPVFNVFDLGSRKETGLGSVAGFEIGPRQKDDRVPNRQNTQ